MAVTVQIMNSGVTMANWTGLADATNGDSADLGWLSDKTFTATGTFAGATITIQGSNDGTNWFGLTDQAGVALTFAAGGCKLCAQNPRFVRPVTAGGAGAALTVQMCAKSQ